MMNCFIEQHNRNNLLMSELLLWEGFEARGKRQEI
jgi:hypothetical protein